MWRLACALWAVLLLALPPAGAQSTGEAGIRAVITDQIEAFRRDDAAAAFAIASPEIQAIFRDPDSFMRMVATGYPEVYRPRSFRFLALAEEDGRLLQRVIVEGPGGGLVTAVYDMVEVAGRWRINGCLLLRGADT
jgi:hypothetical protein